jgi:hypothetical protein
MSLRPATKGFWLGVAVTLVVVGVLAFVKVYTSDVRIEDCSHASCVNTVEVVVAAQDIPPNTELDPLIDAGLFRITVVPIDWAVPHAVTSFDQLRGQTTAAMIYKNEQIPIERLGKPCKKVCI